jgi:HSF-type DNA-binding
MPRYFETSTWKSYQRNINLWSFHTTRKGINKGYTTHACFRRGKVDLCREMTRVRIKGTGKKRTLAPVVQDEAANETVMADGNHDQEVSQMPTSRNQAALNSMVAFYQRLPPSLASSGEPVASSVNGISRTLAVAPFMGARALMNRPWLGVASNPTGGGHSFANVDSCSQILAAANGIRARNNLLTVLLSQQTRLVGRGGLVAGFPFAVPKDINNQQQQQQGAIMASLLRHAMNSSGTPGSYARHK